MLVLLSAGCLHTIIVAAATHHVFNLYVLKLCLLSCPFAFCLQAAC